MGMRERLRGKNPSNHQRKKPGGASAARPILPGGRGA